MWNRLSRLQDFLANKFICRRKQEKEFSNSWENYRKLTVIWYFWSTYSKVPPWIMIPISSNIFPHCVFVHASWSSNLRLSSTLFFKFEFQIKAEGGNIFLNSSVSHCSVLTPLWKHWTYYYVLCLLLILSSVWKLNAS